jgi:uncharacterized membrane protein
MNPIFQNQNHNINKLTDDSMPKKQRFVEIDVAKGGAVLLMIFFHYFYLGKHMNIINVNTDSGLLYMCAKIAHITFIIASGMNLAISTSGKSSSEYIPKKVKRGLYLLAVGLIISYLTKMEFGDSYVKFGIMHFIGIATILSAFVMKVPILTYIISAVILLIHIMLKTPSFKNKFLDVCEKNPAACFIGGIMNLKYNSLDHFGLIPYLGYFLLGSAIAFTCYKIKNVENELDDLNQHDNINENSDENGRKVGILGILDNYSHNPIIKGLAWVGRRSMMWYIVHFTILYCIFKIIQINRSKITIE